MHKRLITALAATTALTACQDVGLPDRNLPFEEARDRPGSALVRAVHDEPARDTALTRPVAIGDRIYMAAGRTVRLSADQLQSVGSTGGRAYSALAWDDAPYDRLFTPALQPGEWRELRIAPTIGPAREPNAEAAAHAEAPTHTEAPAEAAESEH